MGFRELTLAMDNVRCLKAGPKFVLAMIADRVYPQEDDFGDLIPRAPIYIKELCERTEMSRTAVFRHLDYLESIGLIARESRWNEARTSGRTVRSASVYALNVDAIRRGDFIPEGKSPVYGDSPNLGPTETVFAKTPAQVDSPNLGPTVCKSQKPRTLVPKSAFVSPAGGTVIDNKDINPSPLPPTEKQSEESGSSGGGRASRLDGAAAPGMEDHNSEPMTASSEEASGKADTTLIDRCLPPEMRRGLAPRHREQLARMLAERLSAGWSEQAICETLASRELPPQVRSLYGLVRARLERDVPPDSPVAPVSCDDSSAGQTVPAYRRSDGSAVPGWAICWGDVAVEWGKAQAAGQCGPDVSKQAWLSTQDCDRFIDELKLRRGRRA